MVTFFITSTMLILSVLAIRFLLKNRVSFLILYPLWGLVLIRLLIPFTPFESPISVMNFISQADKKAEVVLQKEGAEGQADIKETAETSKEDAVLWNQEQKKQSEQKQQEEPKQSEEKETAKGEGQAAKEEKTIKQNAGMTGQAAEKNLSENNTQKKTAITQYSKKEGWHIQMKRWGISLWVIGSILFLLCILLSNILFYRRLHSDRVRIDCADIDILKTPVYVTGQVHTPCLAGVLHPAVYLPADVYEDKKSLRQILAHEQMHVIHKDYIWTLLRTLCLVIYWFDPLVWLAAFYAKQDAEIACDEAVLRGCSDTQRYDYGEMLIQMSQLKRQSGFCLATSIGNGKWNLRERVVMLTKKRKKAWWQTAVMFVLVAVLAGCGLTKEKQTVESEVDKVKNVTIKKSDEAKENQEENVIKNETKAEEELSEEEKILQAFRDFMETDIKMRPEWKNWEGKEEELYISVQYVGSEDETQEKAPCLLVAKNLIEGTDYASEAFVYYYDIEAEEICLLTVIAGFDKDDKEHNIDPTDANGNPYPIQIDGGELIVKARSAVRYYDWYHTKDYTKLSAQEVADKEWNKKQEVKLKDDEYEAWLLNSSSRYTLASLKWEIPLMPSDGKELDAAKKIRQEDIDSYASESNPASPFSPPKARNIFKRYKDSEAIAFYPNAESSWQELFKTEVTKADASYAGGENAGEIFYVIHGGEDADVLNMLANCTAETFDKVGPTSEESSILQGPIRITYMGHFLDNDSILYFVNMGYTMRSFVLRTRERYDAYIPDKGRWSEDDRLKDMLSSANAPQLLAYGSGMPKLYRADYDNDGEMEVAFHFLENGYTFPSYQVLYLFDNNGSDSYELYTYTKDDFLQPMEKFCKKYDAATAEYTWKKTQKREMSGGGLVDYYYYMMDKKGESNYEFGHEAVYDITLEDDKTEIAVKHGILRNKGLKKHFKGDSRYIQIRSVLNYQGNGKFLMKDTEVIKEE